ncbi:aldehyde dehydrogenase family protein [Mycolicibacterium sp. NCC-Tsukiji]|uniref:aldehyde dehydrogenase family protein n=1 Tax=Mycolicibacterium sp. NCC-Tsukiji TaxID=2185272 RepID=UPI000EE368F5|nr:aldehyde dehydrogenase family protein [Mycolicibacterium sp. NCC-Tsukiji]GCB00250.1 aldehyde dehydrogenase [Mycolicibacterium sp. NCC-Tsukiji]
MTTDSVAAVGASIEPGPSIPEIVAGLRRTYATGRTRDLQWRKRQLLALAQAVEDNESAIAKALEADLGRKPFEAWLTDTVGTIAEAKDAAKNVHKWAKRRYRLLERSQLPGRGWVEYEPYGTVLIIGAWNFPFFLTLGPLVGALAAGNTVVLKPSEFAPASSRLMAELVERYLDTDAIAVVEGDGMVSQELIAQGLDRIMFTGGTEIGKKIMAAAAPHLTPVTLELGGKSPVIVAADADIDVAAKRIAFAKLINSGQICIAPDYVVAEAPIRDQLVTKIRDAIEQFRAKDTGGMPIVNERQFNRLTGYLNTGGETVIGGNADARALTIQPTVVVDPPLDGPLMCEEIFGPILPVVTVESLGAAIEFVNARPKPLAAYLFTKSKTTRERVIREVPSGGMLVNHLIFHVATSKLPFGGVGPSGMGAYHGKYGFLEFSHCKSVMTKPTRPDLGKLIYPPYTDKAWKLARKFF